MSTQWYSYTFSTVWLHLQVLDDKNVRRRFRASNYQSTTRVKPFICTMPMRLDDGWNQIQFNLADFTRRAYGTNYVETLRVQIHANCRIRRVYFSDRLYSEEELPAEFKLYLPVQQVRIIKISVAYFPGSSEIISKMISRKLQTINSCLFTFFRNRPNNMEAWRYLNSRHLQKLLIRPQM